MILRPRLLWPGPFSIRWDQLALAIAPEDRMRRVGGLTHLIDLIERGRIMKTPAQKRTKPLQDEQ